MIIISFIDIKYKVVTYPDFGGKICNKYDRVVDNLPSHSNPNINPDPNPDPYSGEIPSTKPLNMFSSQMYQNRLDNKVTPTVV